MNRIKYLIEEIVNYLLLLLLLGLRAVGDQMVRTLAVVATLGLRHLGALTSNVAEGTAVVAAVWPATGGAGSTNLGTLSTGRAGRAGRTGLAGLTGSTLPGGSGGSRDRIALGLLTTRAVGAATATNNLKGKKI